MMVKMPRNLNLEEVETDALFGIEQLKYQSVAQKIIFFSALIIGAVVNIFLPLFFPRVPSVVRVLVFVFCVIVGVLFGANFNQDMSIFKYFVYFFSKSNKNLALKSTEEISEIRLAQEQIRRDEDEKINHNYDRKDSMKSVKVLIILAILMVIFLIGIYIFSIVLNSNGYMHHEI